MLVIRRDQMTAFQAEADRRFVQFVVSHLRQRYPARTAGLDDGELERKVGRSLTEAREYGIDESSSALRFIDARFRFGPAFAGNAQALHMLADRSRPAIQRVDAAIRAALKAQ